MPPLDREPLDAIINVRVSEREKAAVRTSAATAGLSISAYCRRRFLGRPVIAHGDRAIIRELRRQGGLLKSLHTESHGAYSDATAAALDSIRCYIEKLAK